MANPVLTRGFQQPSGPLVVEDRMTGPGVTRATLTLFGLFLAAGTWGWFQVDVSGALPSWFMVALLVGLGAVIVGMFKPTWARFIGPVYAIAEGALVGAISSVYGSLYDGIVGQAILGTLLTTVIMAVLYATRTIRVTEKFRSVVIGATMGIFVFYLVSLGLSFFNIDIPFLFGGGAIGILFSVGVIILAAFNLMLDFDLIERGVKGGAPAYMNWYAGFGLLVTVVWLYLEILRLLAKLQRD
jgi:uncharacterized YccA/Bax inhibitor family protein